MYLLTEWEGRTGKYLARGHGIRTERSEVRSNSVNKHFIIWPPRFFFSFFFFFIYSGNKIRNVAHFDRKVGIYIATKLF